MDMVGRRLMMLALWEGEVGKGSYDGTHDYD